MENAKLEFLQAVYGLPPIQCAYVQRDYQGTLQRFYLKVGHSESDYIAFVESLDFEHWRALMGSVVWFTDNTWLEREDGDTQEYWAYHRLPEIPSECFNSLTVSRS